MILGSEKQRVKADRVQLEIQLEISEGFAYCGSILVSTTLDSAMADIISSRSVALQTLVAQPIGVEAFLPYGQVIFASEDGKPYDATEAQLQLEQGIPRFYIMRLGQRGRKFSQITRHQKCTQCLGSLEGKPWLMAVAPPGLGDRPAPDAIVAFQIPGNCFIKLNVGAWHAGPYFDSESIDFYNLELSDTNIVDHQTCDLKATYGLEFLIEEGLL